MVECSFPNKVVVGSNPVAVMYNSCLLLYSLSWERITNKFKVYLLFELLPDIAKLVSDYKITGDTCRFFSLLSGCNLHLELGTKQSHSKIISNSNENFMVVLQKAKFKMFFRMFNLMNCIWNKWIYLFKLASFQKNCTCCLRPYLHACLLSVVF